MSDIALKAWNILKNIIGWGLILLAALFFVASILPLAAGNYGVFATGLMMSFLVLILGSEIKTDKEKIRKRIAGLMSTYFPKCPICESNARYEVRGLFSLHQYVRCKTCGAHWTSNDFVGYKDLKSLNLSEPPEDPDVYGAFMSQSALKPRRTYSVKLWKSAMKSKEMQIPTKERHIRIKNLIMLHRRGVGYFTISLGASILSAVLGYHFFSLSIAESYTLFVSTFFVVFMGLLVLRERA